MWGVVPIVMDWLTFYHAVIEGDFTRRRARDAGGDHPALHTSGGGADVVCITSGPSTSTLDQFSDHCFILTHFLAYVVFARYKWLRRAHLSGRRGRSVWTGDHDHGTYGTATAYYILHTTHYTLPTTYTTGDHEVHAVMVWDALTTLIFTVVTSGILTYVIADKPFFWFTNLFRQAPEPKP